MWDLIRALTTDLFKIPRYKNADGEIDPNYDEKSYLWRLKNVTITSALVLLVAAHLGDVYIVDGGRFAANQDLKDIKTQQLEERLDKYYALLCMRPGQEEVLELVRRLQEEYRKIAGRTYEPLDCELLLEINA